MDFLTILVFSGSLFIFMSSPGPGTFAVVARALGSGFSPAFSMSLGMVLGDLVFLLMAIFGLNAIAQMMGDIFVLVKYIGGIYLIYLGTKIFFSKPLKTKIDSSKSKSLAKDFVSGFLICISNPKVILFYLGFLPTFVNLTSLSKSDVFIVSSLVVIILTIVLGGYSYFASRTRDLIKKPKTQTLMSRLAGSIMFGAGVTLILKN